jgi:hypothetical protein
MHPLKHRSHSSVSRDAWSMMRHLALHQLMTALACGTRSTYGPCLLPTENSMRTKKASSSLQTVPLKLHGPVDKAKEPILLQLVIPTWQQQSVIRSQAAAGDGKGHRTAGLLQKWRMRG